MKKVLFGMALAAVFAVQAEDAYIYWLMDNSGSGYTYDSIQVSAVGSGTGWKATPLSLAIDSDDGYITIGNTVSKEDAAALASAGYGFYVNLGQYASDAYTYYFELVADGDGGNDPVVVAHSEFTWDDAQKYLAKNAMQGGGTVSGGALTPSSGGGFAPGPAPVPEPTSGVMLLLGVAALALRRCRT